jgi:hypothetical protein
VNIIHVGGITRRGSLDSAVLCGVMGALSWLYAISIVFILSLLYLALYPIGKEINNALYPEEANVEILI